MTLEAGQIRDEVPEAEARSSGHVGDVVLSMLTVIGGVAVFVYGQTLPPHPAGTFGPGLFPSILGGFLVVFGVVLGALGIYRIVRDRGSHALGRKRRVVESQDEVRTKTVTHGKRWLDVAAALGAIAFYILFADQLGFIITVAIIQVCLMIKFGHKILWSIIIAMTSTLVLYWAFDQLLLIQLPDGILG